MRRGVRPEDIATVERSVAQLCLQGPALHDHLEASFRAAGATDDAARRARWLVNAVAELAALLAVPSRLEVHARDIAQTVPDGVPPPTFGVDGRAWMQAARELCPGWSEGTEDAWHHAWLLLSNVLDNESLSPFADPPEPAAGATGS
jgi:hemoglobin-like flavoprotein